VWALAVWFFIDILVAMNRTSITAAALLAGAALSAGMAARQAFANDTSSHTAATQTPTAKRQTIKDCMSRKMTADRTLSYNGAAKVCAAILKPPRDETASNTPLKQ